MHAQRASILVTGGAGYIGAPSVFYLLQQKYKVIVIDKKPLEGFSLKHLVTPQLQYYQADYGNRELIEKLCREHHVIACMHFAASIEVGASVLDPAAYYDNNVVKSIQLLDGLRAAGVKRIIFSSSCAVYGTPHWLPLTEDHPKNPVSPYGRTKYMIEMIIEDYARAYGLQYALLRYFNASGGIQEMNHYEQHEPESHLIPRVLRAALQGTPLTIFGTDYETHDGSCVRDYIHIQDLAAAHSKALEYLCAHESSVALNLGTGSGYSVLEIIAHVQEITGKKIEIVHAPRRAGDPAILVADPKKAHEILQWTCQFSTLRHILESAYKRESYEAPPSPSLSLSAAAFKRDSVR